MTDTMICVRFFELAVDIGKNPIKWISLLSGATSGFAYFS